MTYNENCMKLWHVMQWRIKKKYRIIYKQGPSTVAAIFFGVAVSAWLLFLLFSSFPVLAYAYYFVRPLTSSLMAKALQETSKQHIPETVVPTPPTSTQIPTKDISLPEGHYVSIPAIGVDTIIWEATEADYESALKRGVWRVPEFGEPGQTGKPTIFVAHRFGYIDWAQSYRLANSFYNLPKLKVGDSVEVIWDQRRYTYSVERVVEGEKIDDYSGDLILYTCKFLVSPLRIFVYARLVQ